VLRSRVGERERIETRNRVVTIIPVEDYDAEGIFRPLAGGAVVTDRLVDSAA